MLGSSQHSQLSAVPIILETPNQSHNNKSFGNSQQGSQLYPAFSRRQSARYITAASPIQPKSRFLKRSTSETRGNRPRRSIFQHSVPVGSQRERKPRIQDPTIEQNADGTWTTRYNEKRSLPWSTRSSTVNSPYSQKIRQRDPELGNQINYGLGLTHQSSASGETPSLATIQSTMADERPRNFFKRLEDRLWRCKTSGNLSERWSLEIISWVISAICMTIVVLLLLFMKDKSIPNWPYTLALTVFFKIATAALLLPTSEALGQLKWSWMKGDSKMWDLEIFELASRGPWGSILLLFRTKCVKLAALGAAITLLSLALDPIFQQVTDFSDRWKFQGNSSIPKIINYDPEIGIVISGGKRLAQTNTELSAPAVSFFYGNGTQPVLLGNVTRPEIPLSCPTGNCTWLPYETLGFCSACVDISEHLKFACLTTTVDWTNNLTGPGTESTYPNGTVCGHFLNVTSTAPVLMSGYSVTTNGSIGDALLMRALPLVGIYKRVPFWEDGSLNFKHYRNRLADVIIASAANGSASVYRNETPVAHECMIALCVKTLVSSFYQAKYEEAVVATFFNTTGGPYPWEFSTVPPLNFTRIQYTENVTIVPPVVGGDNIEYGINNMTALTTLGIFDDVFPSFLTVETPSAEPFFRFKTRLVVPQYRTLEFNPWAFPNNLTQHFERMATAMTNNIRSSSSSIGHVGMAYERESYVAVHWAWLSLPFGLLALSGVFLVATMIKTSKEPEQVAMWKMSTAESLFYGEDGIGKPRTTSKAHSASSLKGF